jgi:hypothetical protein
MHGNQLGVVFYLREGGLDVVAPGAAVGIRVGDGQVPLPHTEAVKGVCEVEFRFVALVGPVVDG